MSKNQFRKLRIGDFISWYNTKLKVRNYDFVLSIDRENNRITPLSHSGDLSYVAVTREKEKLIIVY